MPLGHHIGGMQVGSIIFEPQQSWFFLFDTWSKNDIVEKDLDIGALEERNLKCVNVGDLEAHLSL